MAKYGKKAQETVEKPMVKKKAGKLKSGSGKKMKSPKRATKVPKKGKKKSK